MAWLPILVLTAFTLTLQTVLAPRIELLQARPDLLLLFAVFLGLYAPRHRAIVLGWFLGFSADLLTVERMGLLSLTYGLTVIALVSLREFLFQRRAVTHFLATLVAGLLIRTAWSVYAEVLYGLPSGGPLQGLKTVGFAAFYTAALAPFVHAVLLRGSAMLGLPRSPTSARMSLGFNHV